jgi:hypothetical protein
MTLNTLRTLLQTLTGTSIVNVYFDWKRYLNKPDKGYPHVLWSLNGASFSRDARVSTVKNKKILICSAFAVAYYDFQNTDDIPTYDTLEGQFEVYINKINAMSGLKVLNIDNLKGVYLSEGSTSAAKEIGIMYENIQIEMNC